MTTLDFYEISFCYESMVVNLTLTPVQGDTTPRNLKKKCLFVGVTPKLKELEFYGNN